MSTIQQEPETVTAPSSRDDRPSATIHTDEAVLRIFRSIRRIIRSVEIYSRQLALNHGITSPQLVCLRKLVENDGLSIKQLAESVFLSSSTVVGIVDRLEAKNLVTRERSKRDRRVLLLHATDKGRLFIDTAPSPMQDALRAALDEVSEIEKASIAQSLERLIDIMEIHRLDAAPILERGVTLERQGAIEEIAAETDEIETDQDLS